MNNTNITADNNQAYYMYLFPLLNKTISQYGLGFIWLIGNIGSILTCIVFFQPAFRSSPCAMYFIASGVSQFFTFNFALFTGMLQFGYGVQTINTSLWYCKIRYYFFYIFVAISRYNIILASIDRYFASSRDVLRRRWSSKKIAIRLIIGNAVFWCLIYIQIIVFYEIETGVCRSQTGIYGKFFSIYITIDSGILPILLMLIFGLLTIKSVNRIKQRIRPGVEINNNQPNNIDNISKKDAQLYKMLANQIVIFIILNIANPCYLLYRSFTMDNIKSSIHITIDSFISNMTYVLINLGFSLTFPTFVVSSKMFRREFLQFIRTKILQQSVASTVAARTVVGIIHDGNAS